MLTAARLKMPSTICDKGKRKHPEARQQEKRNRVLTFLDNVRMIKKYHTYCLATNDGEK